MQWISETLSMLRIQDVIDIAIVAVIIYWLFKLIKGTRAEQLSKGIVVVLILTKLSEILQIYMLNYLLKSMLTWGFWACSSSFNRKSGEVLNLLAATAPFERVLSCRERGMNPPLMKLSAPWPLCLARKSAH